ncbi:hypothetical protein F0562_029658 [Nyssa sinensis]|uniref:Uncharacterized protein n=1 Tax=Nyssa sinensis TaxID=561372 RepID=A0A5J5B3P7_9ASTE|nr:hypothetical protein F0562_029658 [Nyssa sinensis]
MEIGATSTATLLDNSVSTLANASQPEFSTKITEQQETPYAIQPINPMEIGTTSSDPLLDCPDILQRESYQNPSGHVTAMPSNQPPRLLLHNAGVEFPLSPNIANSSRSLPDNDSPTAALYSDSTASPESNSLADRITKVDEVDTGTHVSLSKFRGEDVTVMEAQGLAESISASVLNANISNVHGRHDLSALLLESRLDDISESVDGHAREDALINDTYSGHSWADRAEEGEFIPQVALDLEAESGGFLEDPSFFMESFQGDASFPSLRGSRNLNNGSHKGHGGGGRGARVACGIQTNKHSIRPALCGKEGLSFQDQHRECPLGNRETQGGNGRPSLE